VQAFPKRIRGSAAPTMGKILGSKRRRQISEQYAIAYQANRPLGRRNQQDQS